MMSDTADVVDRANSLISRRRSFVATRPSQPEPPPVAVPLPEDDDVPVLTEIISAEEALSEADEIADRHDETQITLLASEIAHAFGEQLANDLPALLEAALVRAGDDLRAGISSIMDSALRDFIAHRQQLHLPLEEPPENP